MRHWLGNKRDWIMGPFLRLQREKGDSRGYLYRFTDIRIGDSLKIVCEVFPIIKRTPHGAWISMGWGDKKFVLLDARKKYACEGETTALRSFFARKRSQIKILEDQLDRAKEALRLAREIEEKERP